VVYPFHSLPCVSSPSYSERALHPPFKKDFKIFIYLSPMLYAAGKQKQVNNNPFSAFAIPSHSHSISISFSFPIHIHARLINTTNVYFLYRLYI
jgi:hypothetical protein